MSTDIYDNIRKHESVGRAFLYSLFGEEIEASATGSYMTSSSNREFLNWGGYSVFLLGHSYPKIVQAIQNQLGVLPLSTRAFPHTALKQFHVQMASMAPIEIEKFMLLNSGSEAVEAAIKLARIATKRSTVMYLEKSYHGKTQGALSVTDSPIFRDPIPNFVTQTQKISRTDSEEAFSDILSVKPAAVIMEPIQGEGGIFELSQEYCQKIRDACNQVGALLISDEIQCGLGRSGELWPSVRLGLEADIILLGKALGGGILPVSAMLATKSAFQPFDRDPLIHSSTFGGNPLAAAAAAATLSVISENSIPDISRNMGNILKQNLNELASDYPDILEEVLGRGLLLGLKFTTPDKVANFMQSCVKSGLLLTPCLTTPSVVRISPAATMTSQEINKGLDILSLACKEVIKN